MSSHVPYEAIPSGWYVVAESKELARGRVSAVRYFDRELVLYRTEQGTARLVDAYCPHLGAFLGDGCVRGENLRCPFHGFEFGLDGGCVSTPYRSGIPPAKARLGGLLVREKHGFVFAWYDRDGREPTWEPPDLGIDDFTHFRVRSYRFRGHPQEVSENSVDLGHFSEVHNYRSAELLGDMAIEGHVLRSRFRVVRSLDFLGLPRASSTLEIGAEVHGLGFSVVRASLGFGFDMCLLVLPTPEDASHVHLRIAAAVRPLPVPGITSLVHRFTLASYAGDFQHDIPIWEKKRYVEHPLLAQGDGPIVRYRRYAEQFYPRRRVSLPRAQDAAE